VLQEAEEALGGEGVAEHLEHAGERPEAAGTVEVQEVRVRHVAGQHPLGEDEHEALFHRRALVAQQASQRQSERGGDEQEAQDVTSSRGDPPGSHGETS
jgi:hypothetical protein